MDNGGPAFPTTTTISDPFSGQQSSATINGMTLRDWFAGQAFIADVQFPDMEEMCAFVGEPKPDGLADGYFTKLLAIAAKAQAKLRYAIADAMLAERSRQ